MEDEPDLIYYWNVVNKRKWMIVGLTLLIVIIAAIVSFATPKTYESDAIIQLGEVNGKLIFKPEEAKIMIRTSRILEPVIDKFFLKEERPSLIEFNKKILEVDFIKEQVQPGTYVVTNYVYLKIRSNNAVKSKEMVLAVIDEFFDYADEGFNEKKNMVVWDYNQTKRQAEKEFNIQELKKDISDLQKQIGSLSSSDLSTEGISKITLLNSILDSYKSRLLDEKNKKISLEQTLTTLEIDLDEKLVNTNEFKIISEPSVPSKHVEPKIRQNLAIALVLGLFFSVLLAFFLEAIKGKHK